MVISDVTNEQTSKRTNIKENQLKARGLPYAMYTFSENIITGSAMHVLYKSTR